MAVVDGYKRRSLQRLPHITLLDFEFYFDVLKPILAEWAFLWLQKNHLHGVDRAEAVCIHDKKNVFNTLAPLLRLNRS